MFAPPSELTVRLPLLLCDEVSIPQLTQHKHVVSSGRT